ncbi:lariat debranching enzyme, C-terminal domain-containing protein [Phycomyces blakesleeanus]
MKIAIEGCCHGELDNIYGTIKLLEQRENYKIDLVLICGDFQAIRNTSDMECMSVPPKFRELGTFWKYYSGLAKAPYPTIFIGGNHEASNHLWELYHGGWVCENIYYLGHAGVINYKGVRIGGISGIFKSNDYRKGHYETSPYTPQTIKSVYHVRDYDVQKVLQIQKPVDIFLSHDWPRGIERFGDVGELLRVKTFFREEARTNTLGSPANEQILTKIQPAWWFAAHLHVKFAALVDHEKWKNEDYSDEVKRVLNLRNGPYYQASIHQNQSVKVENPDEISISMSDDDDDEDCCTHGQRSTEKKVGTRVDNPDEISISVSDDEDDEDKDDTPEKESPVPVQVQSESPKITKFLSLDKCLPRRQFLQVIDVPSDDSAHGFSYDLEWLAITKSMHPYLSVERQEYRLPSNEDIQMTIKKELTQLEAMVGRGELDLKIPNNFQPTAPTFNPSVQWNHEQTVQFQYPFSNPQTSDFCKMLNIQNKINPHGMTDFGHEKVAPEQQNSFVEPQESSFSESIRYSLTTLNDDMSTLTSEEVEISVINKVPEETPIPDNNTLSLEDPMATGEDQKAKRQKIVHEENVLLETVEEQIL